MIEDKELRNLFKIESEEQLQHLDAGLLELEKTPDNTSLLERMFRDIHSLKGGARMLLLPDIEVVAHHFEGILGAAKEKEILLTSEVLDQLYAGLDALRKLGHEAVTGEPAGVSVTDIVEGLSSIGEKPQKKPKVTPDVISLHENEEMEPVFHLTVGERTTETPGEPETKTPSPAPSDEAPGNQSPAYPLEPYSEKAFHIDTIRVPTEKLDALMTLLGELSVTKNRFLHRHAMIEDGISVWEKLNDLMNGHCSLPDENVPTFGNEAIRNRLECYSRETELLEHLGRLLTQIGIGSHEDCSKLGLLVDELTDGVRSVRLLPLSTVFDLFPRLVRDLARTQNKEVRLVLQGGETTADKRIIEDIKAPLMHMIRNAVDHGIESPEDRERLGKPHMGTIELKASKTAGSIFIELRDDGRGLDTNALVRTALKRDLIKVADLETITPEEIRSLIFMPGFSTATFISDVSGRGVGLDVVRANVERLKGEMEVGSTQGEGCTFTVRLPITMAAARVLTMRVGNRKFALLVEHVDSLHLVKEQEIFTIEERTTIVVHDRPLSVVKLADLLELQETTPHEQDKGFSTAATSSIIPCVVTAVGEDRLGLLVDELVDEQEIVLKPQSKLLKRVRNIAGATILGTGEVCMVLNPHDLLKSAQKREFSSRFQALKEDRNRTKSVLMADDTLTTRTQMKRILESAGYEVVAAVDGSDAFAKLATRSFDALVSDVMMPNMDGLTLVQEIRKDQKYQELPIILVTTLSSDEDRKKGLDAGADAYIAKPAFDQKMLLDTLRRLI